MKLFDLISRKRIGAMLAGVVLLVILVWWQGAGEIGRQIVGIGWVFAAVMGLALFSLILRAFSWKIVLGSTVPFPALLKLKAGGDSLNALSSLIPIRGDSLNVQELRRKFQINDATDSIVIERGLRRLILLPFVRVGFPLLPPAVRGRWEEMDRLLRRFYRERRPAFFAAFFLNLLGQGLYVAEIWLIGRAVLPGFSLPMAVILAIFQPVVAALFSFIPAALGILELSFAGLLWLFVGWAGVAAGVVISLARRVLGLFWIVAGLVLGGNPFRAFSR